MNDCECPECGAEIKDLSEIFGNDCHVDFECPHCKAKLHGTADITYYLMPTQPNDSHQQFTGLLDGKDVQVGNMKFVSGATAFRKAIEAQDKRKTP